MQNNKCIIGLSCPSEPDASKNVINTMHNNCLIRVLICSLEAVSSTNRFHAIAK